MKWKTQAKKFLVIAFLCVLLIIQVSAASGYTIVYVTNTGEKYHSYGCQYLRKSCISISLSSAVSSGYTRCSKCNPPILDATSNQPSSSSGTQSSYQPSSWTDDEVLELKKKIDNLTGQISFLKDRNSYLENQLDLFEEEWISQEEAENMVQDAVKEKEAEYQRKLTQQENADKEETVFLFSLFAIVFVFAGYLIKKAMDFPIIKNGENAVRAYQNQLNTVQEELNTVKCELNATMNIYTERTDTMADYPVKINCPIRNVEETVFFHPIEIDGKWYVDINSFNGCDIGWSKCKECEDCKLTAYKKMFDRP